MGDDKTKEQLETALKARLAAMIDRGITARNLSEVEKFARYARDLLAVGTEEEALRLEVGNASLTSSSPAYYTMNNPLVQGDSAETFGAKFMREQIAANGVRDLSPKEVIEAMVIAKQHGLCDLASKLEASFLRSIDSPGVESSADLGQPQ